MTDDRPDPISAKTAGAPAPVAGQKLPDAEGVAQALSDPAGAGHADTDPGAADQSGATHGPDPQSAAVQGGLSATVDPVPETGAGAMPGAAPARTGFLAGEARRRHARAAKLRPRVSLPLGLFLFFMFMALFGAGWLASGRVIQLPPWAVAELEHRLNRRLIGTHLPPGASVEIGGIELGTGPDLAPRLSLRGLQLIEPDGARVLALPEVRLSVAAGPLFFGEIRPTGLRLSGARMAMARDADGRIALSFAGFSGAPRLQSAAEILDAVDAMFSSELMSRLRLIEAEGLALSLEDARAGRTWEVGDGRLVIENRADSVRAELGLTLLDSGEPAQVRMALESTKTDSSAKLWANIENVRSGDLALQAAPLAFLSVIEAPISGEIFASLDPQGVFGRMEGKLSLGAGHLDPGALTDRSSDVPPAGPVKAGVQKASAPEAPLWGQGSALLPLSPMAAAAAALPASPDAAAPLALQVTGPVAFDQASLSLSYDPSRQRVTLDALSVESDTLRLKATGTADLQDGAGQPAGPGELPKAMVTQLALSDVMVDPEGLFEAPARFSEGAASFRLTLDPFRIDLGEAMLIEGADRITLSGRAGFDRDRPEGARWEGAVDVRLNQISADRLIRLWPVSAVPKTRKWLAENVGQGELTDVSAALRLRPGRAPRFALDYEFSGAQVRFIRTLPPVSDGRGRANILDNVYTLVLEGGHVTAPEGGAIDVEGSVFQVLDITQKPAQAEVRLVTHAGLKASLSLLDQEPFRFITKAGQRVDLGEGQADLVAELRFPLVQKLRTGDVFFDVTGTVTNFTSDLVVPGKVIAAPALDLHVTPRQMQISGKGTLEGVPVSAVYKQDLGPDAKGKPALVNGTAQLSDAGLRRLGVDLPAGWITGEAPADVALEIVKGSPVKLALTSGLKGLGLAIPPLSFSKGAAGSGKLSLTALLGAAPEVTGFTLSAPGLEAEGRITTKPGVGLDRLSLSRIRVGNWLDAPAELTGRGKGKMPAIRLTGGTLDLRALPAGAGGGAGGAGAGGNGPEIEMGLDRLIVTEGVSLTGLSGAFVQRLGGLDGTFVAAVNGIGRIRGATVPHKGGTAVRIMADDAGRVIAAAGIFAKGQGGALDMTLQPVGRPGEYLGSASFTDLSVQNAPVLAELLSAASVVGLLEQMQGQGIFFSEGDMRFDISKAGVQIRDGAAIGASMGISFEGLYNSRSEELHLQGTISPIYLLNGIGQIFTRKGEGLFGFNYTLSGPAKNPQVSVNPLSILTPGMFRDIFRRPVPTLN